MKTLCRSHVSETLPCEIFKARLHHWHFFRNHWIKSVRIWSYSGPHFSCIFSHLDWIRRDSEYKNADKNNSECGHFLRSEWFNFLFEEMYKKTMHKTTSNDWLGRFFICLVFQIIITLVVLQKGTCQSVIGEMFSEYWYISWRLKSIRTFPQEVCHKNIIFKYFSEKPVMEHFFNTAVWWRVAVIAKK